MTFLFLVPIPNNANDFLSWRNQQIFSWASECRGSSPHPHTVTFRQAVCRPTVTFRDLASRPNKTFRMERGTSSESSERGPRTNKPRIRRSLRKFVTHIHSTVHRQELFWALTHLFHDFNKARSYIREEQINIWVDYVMSCQSTHRSKVDIVRNCKAIESQYLA